MLKPYILLINPNPASSIIDDPTGCADLPSPFRWSCSQHCISGETHIGT